MSCAALKIRILFATYFSFGEFTLKYVTEFETGSLLAFPVQYFFPDFSI
jgi:hypothetical protein